MTMFLSLSLIFFLLWFFLLFLSRSTRKEQLIMSLVGLVLSPAVLLISVGNTQGTGVSPTGIGIEDFLFSFSFFGIAAVIYQALLGKRMKPWKGKRAIFIHPVIHWFAHLVIVLALWIGLSFGFLVIFPLSSSQAFLMAGILIGTYVIAHRHDLFFNAILSGCLVTLLLFILEQIFFFRLSAEGGGIVTPSFSIEMLVWAWVIGFAIGPLYEYLRHKKLV